MRKNLLRLPLWGVVSLALLSACRSENDVLQNKSGDNLSVNAEPFIIFSKSEELQVRNNIKTKEINKSDYYAYGFVKLYYDYNNIKGISEKALKSRDSYIDFTLHSQLLNYENKEGMIFPVVLNGKVEDIVIVWNTIYIQEVINQLYSEGFEISDADFQHISPAPFEHINRLGKYSFNTSFEANGNGLRPLRKI